MACCAAGDPAGAAGCGPGVADTVLASGSPWTQRFWAHVHRVWTQLIDARAGLFGPAEAVATRVRGALARLRAQSGCRRGGHRGKCLAAVRAHLAQQAGHGDAAGAAALHAVLFGRLHRRHVRACTSLLKFFADALAVCGCARPMELAWVAQLVTTALQRAVTDTPLSLAPYAFVPRARLAVLGLRLAQHPGFALVDSARRAVTDIPLALTPTLFSPACLDAAPLSAWTRRC